MNETTTQNTTPAPVYVLHNACFKGYLVLGVRGEYSKAFRVTEVPELATSFTSQQAAVRALMRLGREYREDHAYTTIRKLVPTVKTVYEEVTF